MSGFQLRASIAAFACVALANLAEAGPNIGWSVGVRVGPPVYHRPWHYHGPVYHGPIYRPYPLWYAPPPVVYEAAPIVVRPAPVIVQQPAVVVPATSYSPPAGETVISQSPPASADAVTFHLQRLKSAEEAARAESALELGRMKADRAVDALAAALAGDKSAPVRDAAARALGLIASPSALPTLTYAAQADQDRDVRHSAQFAVEIIRANLKR